jgi:hypothetical protein
MRSKIPHINPKSFTQFWKKVTSFTFALDAFEFCPKRVHRDLDLLSTCSIAHLSEKFIDLKRSPFFNRYPNLLLFYHRDDLFHKPL